MDTIKVGQRVKLNATGQEEFGIVTSVNGKGKPRRMPIVVKLDNSAREVYVTRKEVFAPSEKSHPTRNQNIDYIVAAVLRSEGVFDEDYSPCLASMVNLDFDHSS